MIVPEKFFPARSSSKFSRSIPFIIMEARFFRCAKRAPTGSTGVCDPGFHFAGINFLYSFQIKFLISLAFLSFFGSAVYTCGGLPAKIDSQLQSHVIRGPSGAPTGRNCYFMLELFYFESLIQHDWVGLFMKNCS